MVAFPICKTQPLTATSSTKAEFYAAVTAAKHARYLRAILSDLGCPQGKPTLHCTVTMSLPSIINTQIPTEHSCHILIQFFAVQDWKDQGDIILCHIPGILNLSDNLTKPLGWILHTRHCQLLMGHYAYKQPILQNKTKISTLSLQSTPHYNKYNLFCSFYDPCFIDQGEVSNKFRPRVRTRTFVHLQNDEVQANLLNSKYS